MPARRGPTSFDEVSEDLRKSSQFRKAERRVAPYFDLALEVIRRRLDLGLTQKELAERANTFQSRISKIESGEHDIRFSTLIDIAEALQCTITKYILIPLSDAEYRPINKPFLIWSTESNSGVYPQVEYSKVEEYQEA